MRAPQVKLVEFHPVQPWIAYADTGNNVRVWDWMTQQVWYYGMVCEAAANGVDCASAATLSVLCQ